MRTLLPSSRPRRRRLAAALVATLALGACAAGSRDRILHALFDGVPSEPEADGSLDTPAPEPVPAVDVESLGTGATGWIPPVIPSTRRASDRGSKELPPLEQAVTWQDALNLLPTDAVGAVDWIAASEEGLLEPQLLPLERGELSPPYAVGDLVELGIAYPERPFLDLDVEIATPGASPLFRARFPHSSHTLLLACSSCHPGVVAERTTMDGILSGRYCGECHGKVAFEPEVGCARCHTALEPPTKEAVAADLEAVSAKRPDHGESLLERGRALYAENCAVCHGADGDGSGRLADHVETRPRDFTSGKFKFRSTIGSSPPSDLDLFRTITRGVPGTSMPAWSALSIEDRWALVQVVKSFSDRFEREDPGDPIVVPPVPEFTAELLAAGEELYRGAGCHNCHGDDGRGDGPSAAGLKDDWGEPIQVFDLASGREPKNGGEPEDLYRLVLSGLPGTPMPGFGLALQPEQTWAITAHVMSLREGDRQPLAVRGDIHFVRDETLTASLEGGAHAAPQFTQAEMPPAIFPHWFHRVRFKCSSCHPDTFTMEAGSNPITMDSLRRGEFCATCHNGTVAWQVGFESCVRCHVQP